MKPIPKSLPRICVALGMRTPEALAHAAELEVKDGNTFLEFRLDYLLAPDMGIGVFEKLLKQNPELQILATCRRRENKGGYAGPIEEQIDILGRAAKAGALLIDLEIESAEPAKKRLAELRQQAAVIVSYHNFESTPSLSAVWRRLQRIEADAYKIATTARKPSDALRISEFFRARHDAPLIAFAMSELGVSTRILSLAAGCLFTYAAPLESEGTAPGQIQAKLMRGLYRADKLGKHSRVFGVIADPVAHSKSPQIHNRAFQSKRIDAVYLPFRVGVPALGDWMKLADGLPISGFSVTIPHKQRILRYLDLIDPLARRIGAVNTVWKKSGKWRGTNTDVAGILKPIEQRVRLSRATLLLAGYGGAARAAAFALHDAGAKITVTGRDEAKAKTLAKTVGADVIGLAAAEKQKYDIVLNATPVGMHPHVERCIFKDNIPGDLVFDMVYNPRETLLLKHAREQGRKVISGAEMFLEQAAEQFEIWTGETAPRAVMRQSLDS